MNVHIEKIYPSNALEAQADQIIFLRHSLEQSPDYAPNIMPMLFAKAPPQSRQRWDSNFFLDLTKHHVEAALKLKQKGFKACVLASDNDGCLQKALSPRFSTDYLLKRMESLCNIYEALKAVIDEVWVLLNIEELAPGGFDATDGVQVAQKLENLGLKNIIISAGTHDFLPLYDRRPTQKKSSQEEDFCSREPNLASSLWALEHTSLNVYSLSFIHDPLHALALAKALGLAGVINKSSN